MYLPSHYKYNLEGGAQLDDLLTNTPQMNLPKNNNEWKLNIQKSKNDTQIKIVHTENDSY